jgi:sulfate adenylyltransferase large subunit
VSVTFSSTELLRLVTAGSVDDGKSTLIGRLLFDSKQIMVDQMEHIEDASRRRGHDYVDLALLTDGLRAEREQGITIDVAYRSFVTPRRRFQLADAPGHVQYTRNMVTGASTADVAVILLDARQGVVEQTRRHAYIASILEIPHVVFAVNKMDLVDFSQQRFDEIVTELEELNAQLGTHDPKAIPMSALRGDNVVDGCAESMPWWDAPPLLEFLEEIQIATDRNLEDRRFPVQWVIRPMSDEHHDYRGYAGRVASGIWHTGDEVVELPSGLRTRVEAVENADGPLDAAVPPMSITVRLEDDIDVSRGNMLADPARPPVVAREVEARVCWMSERPLEPRAKIGVKHTTRTVRGFVEELVSVVDIRTLDDVAAPAQLGLNDIGLVRLRLSEPLCVDPYAENRETGAFILIEEATNDTVGAGMVVRASVA